MQLHTSIYLIYMVINSHILSLISQPVFCYDAFSCVGDTILRKTSRGSIWAFGFKSLQGPTTSINVTYAGSGSAWLAGAFAGENIAFIEEANDILCQGSNSCANVDGSAYIKTTALSKVIRCEGSNGCKNSNLRNTFEESSQAVCNGDASCSNATFEGIKYVWVYAAYGLNNAVYNITGVPSDVSIYLQGYHAGFGATIICGPSETCNINCDGNGCEMLYLQCLGNNNCNINLKSASTIPPITDWNEFDANAINLLYDSAALTEYNEQDCGSHNFQYNDGGIQVDTASIIVNDDNLGPVCCQGRHSCSQKKVIHYNTTNSESIVCSGAYSCQQLNIINNNGPVFCEGYISCDQTDITTTNNIYCLSYQACTDSNIYNAKNVYCSGTTACSGTTIRSSGDINVYLLGEYSGTNAEIYCNQNDNCFILCGGTLSCSYTSIICDGNCIFHCLHTENGCPEIVTSSPTMGPTQATKMPSVSPTQSTKMPSISPTQPPTQATQMPSVSPTTISPTQSPTQSPTTISPTQYPTMNPSIHPTDYPSVRPTHATKMPSISPTQPATQPTTKPTTQYSTMNPSIHVHPTDYPSVSPTQYPTMNPSIHAQPTTQYPTMDPHSNSPIDSSTAPSISKSISDIAARNEEYESQLDNLTGLYRYVAGGFIGTFLLIAIFSWIDATYYRINDYFKVGAIITMIIQTNDMMSDCFFVGEVSIERQIHLQFEYELILYTSIGFVVIPAFMALLQLYFHAKKHWVESSGRNVYVRTWLLKYSTILLLLSILTGSSFAAVSLLNSYMFQLRVFDMGLTDKQLKTFNIQRIYSIVFFENVPQLAIQSYYIYLQEGISNPIVISSIIFSIISIVVSVLSLTIQKTINNTQCYVTISMDITGDTVEDESSKCRTMNHDLRKRIAPLIGVDHNTIKILKPTHISNGLALDIIIYVDNHKRTKKVYDYKKVLNVANDNGKLSKLFEKSWQLKRTGKNWHGPPVVSNISQEITEPKQTKKNAKFTAIHTTEQMRDSITRSNSTLIPVKPDGEDNL